MTEYFGIAKGNLMKLQNVDRGFVFKANSASRRLEGVVVPWGVASSLKGGKRFAFTSQGTRWSQPVGRVPLLSHHDMGRNPLGVAVSFASTLEGLYGVFRIAKTAAGDEALALAEDGILSGFSVGLGADAVYGQPDSRGVHTFTDATIVEVSLVSVPSFDDARVQFDFQPWAPENAHGKSVMATLLS